MKNSGPNCFVGIAPCCGRIVFASVDDECSRETNAKEVARLIRQGYRVEKWHSQEVRAGDWGCKCEKPQKAQK